jgi:hypothetical protein
MATGRLGTFDLPAALDRTLYTCPPTTFAVVTVSICNRSNSAVTCRISLSTTTTPANDEYLEYDTEILPKGVLERTGIVVDAGKNIVVRTSTANCSAVAMGIETPTA